MNALSSNLYFQFSFLNALNWIFKLILWLESNWQTTSTHLEKISFLYFLKSVLVFRLQSSSFKSNSPIKQLLQTADHQAEEKSLKCLSLDLTMNKDSRSKLQTCWFCPSKPLLSGCGEEKNSKAERGSFLSCLWRKLCDMRVCMYGNKPNREDEGPLPARKY